MNAVIPLDVGRFPPLKRFSRSTRARSWAINEPVSQFPWLT
jgi:hypothetical protein